jgi:hypothetical protein
MERQFTGSSLHPAWRKIMMSQSRDESREAKRSGNRIIVLSDVRTTR